MERRDFLKLVSIGTVSAMGGQLALRQGFVPDFVPFEDIDTSVSELADSIRFMSTPAPSAEAYLRDFQGSLIAGEVELARTSSPSRDNYLARMSAYEQSHGEDVFLGRDQYPVLISTFKRLDRVQNLVGHGNFNILGFDEMNRHARNYASVGAFTDAEKQFLEQMFTANASEYGFYGEKVITQLTADIPQRERTKVDRTGHYLYRGKSEQLYRQLKEDLGDSVVLTSGIRSIVKQTHLFLAKTIQSRGNLSRASRSLAPPGHSYHGIGDFDVGKVGFGRRNFTEEFARTPEFNRLVELGYVDIRYPKGNLFGVRYEPWHIKVV